MRISSLSDGYVCSRKLSTVFVSRPDLLYVGIITETKGLTPVRQTRPCGLEALKKIPSTCSSWPLTGSEKAGSMDIS
jgi:hypothetical protein